jgi:hypothetical protein
MCSRYLWVTLVMGAVIGLGAVPAGACADGCAPPPCATTVAAAPAMQTVTVNEWVPETYETVRTVYKTQMVCETYTAFRTECVPVTKTRQVVCNRMVPEWRDEVRTVCVSVPTVETRTVMKKVVTCKPVTTIHRKCVDMGHYECREVPCRESCLARLRKCCHRSDCCDPCPPCPPTKTVKVWCPNKVWVETPVTCMKRVVECVPTCVQVTVCKMVPQQQTVRVCSYRCVTDVKTVPYTCMEARQVAFEAKRMVCKCVPCQEKVTCCRMVCRTVQKQVPVTPCCDVCPITCCSGCSHRHHRRCCR